MPDNTRPAPQILMPFEKAGVLTYEEITQIIKALADHVTAAKTHFQSVVTNKVQVDDARDAAIMQLVDDAIEKMTKAVGGKADMSHLSAQLGNVRAEIASAFGNLRDEMSELPRELADIENELSRLQAAIPPAVNEQGLWKAIGDLQKALTDAKRDMDGFKAARPSIGGLFTPRGFQLLVGGAKKGQVNYLNLIPGAGVTFSYNRAAGRNDITINASAAGLSMLTATGAVNDTNTAFVFQSKPTLIVVNGASYREGAGWSWTAGTSTATLDNPVGAGGDIYALGNAS